MQRTVDFAKVRLGSSVRLPNLSSQGASCEWRFLAQSVLSIALLGPESNASPGVSIPRQSRGL
jgi:hypothetical protein